MKIRLDVDDKHFLYETDPMPPERFKAVCGLVGAAIGGAVLLGAVRMAGFWVIPWAAGVLIVAGLIRLMKYI